MVHLSSIWWLYDSYLVPRQANEWPMSTLHGTAHCTEHFLLVVVNVILKPPATETQLFSNQWPWRSLGFTSLPTIHQSTYSNSLSQLALLESTDTGPTSYSFCCLRHSSGVFGPLGFSMPWKKFHRPRLFHHSLRAPTDQLLGDTRFISATMWLCCWTRHSVTVCTRV